MQIAERYVSGLTREEYVKNGLTAALQIRRITYEMPRHMQPVLY